VKPVTPVMQAAINWMERDPDRRIVRFPGGFWEIMGNAPSFGTKTVQALVDRGIAKYTDWKDGRNGKFPVEARLSAYVVDALDSITLPQSADRKEK
jgi:hypothetical protein